MANLSYPRVLNKDQALGLLQDRFPRQKFSFVHRLHCRDGVGMSYCFRCANSAVLYYVDENSGLVRSSERRTAGQ